MWPFTRKLNGSSATSYVSLAVASLLVAAIIVPNSGFSSTPEIGVGDVTSAMWYETNVEAISSADSSDTDRIIGSPLTTLVDRDDSTQTVTPAWPLNFFGTKYEGLCVTTNGTVSPVATPSTSCSNRYDRGLEQLAIEAGAPLIAAFANDVDGSENVRPDLGVSIDTIRFAESESGNRTLTVTTRGNHGMSSSTSNLCVMAASPDITNGATLSDWRTDEFWYCGTAVNASGSQFEMTVPLTFNEGTSMDITSMTTSVITPVFSRIYISNSTPLNNNVDVNSYDVERGFDGFGHVSAIYYGTATIRGRDAMVVTWYRHAQNDDDNADVLYNTFQIVMIKKDTVNGASNGFDFDFEFNYGTVQDGDDGYSAIDPSRSCTSMTTNCRTGVGVVDFDAGTTDVYELFPDTPSRDLVDWGTTSSLSANSLNATVNGVTTLGRYSFTFTGGTPANFATPVMDGSGQVVGGPGTSSGTPASAVYNGPITIGLTPATVSPSGTKTVAINGRRLGDVTAVYVGNVRVEVVSTFEKEIVFQRPALAPGRYLVRVVSDQGEYSFDGLVIEALESAPTTRTTYMISSFGTNLSVLSASMRGQIRGALSSVPQGARVTCKGGTSGPISLPRDQILANDRSRVACAYISKIRPDLEVKALKGKPGTKVGAKHRKVRIRVIL